MPCQSNPPPKVFYPHDGVYAPKKPWMAYVFRGHPWRWILFSFAATGNAFLLFLIQPLVAKMFTPILGGSPAVWTTCMVFFQTLLLGGYLFSHVAMKRFSATRQPLLHACLLLLSLFLPVFSVLGTPPEAGSGAAPIFWLLLALLIAVGGPYFLLASAGPILQSWYVRAPGAGDPYFLYKFGNIGSLGALLCYPLLIEPFFDLPTQIQSWHWAYIINTGIIILCTQNLHSHEQVMLPDAASTEHSGVSSQYFGGNCAARAEGARHPTAGDEPCDFTSRGEGGRVPPFIEQLPSGNEHALPKMRWILYAFIPSSLLLGLTSYITSDLAPAPLLWVVPLALYLGSFILVFSPSPSFSETSVQIAVFALLVPFIPMMHFETAFPLWAVVSVHLALFFLLSLLFHQKLAHLRPDAENLTSFYLHLALGGMLGGIFNGLIAPMAFRTLIEYPMMLSVAAFLLPIAGIEAMPRTWPRLALYVSIGANAALGILALRIFVGAKINSGQAPAVFLLIALYLLGYYSPRWFRFAAGVSFIFITASAAFPEGAMFADRSFFGAMQVFQDQQKNYRLLFHGSTNHGGQCLASQSVRKPFFYYYPEGPIGQIFDEVGRSVSASAPSVASTSLLNAPSRALAPVAIIGLGAGGLAPYCRPRQRFDFYEIDPMVVAIAKNPDYFSYLSQCPGEARVILGDGRIQLQTAPDHSYGVIILDAYSSDSIPVHLITREAFALYLSKLRDDGLLIFHISNRYLDLETVLGNLCREARLHGYTQVYDPDKTPPRIKEDRPFVYNSRWVMMGKYTYFFGELLQDDRWGAIREKPGARPWTDNFSNLISIYNWQ